MKAMIGMEDRKQKLDCLWLKDLASGKGKTRVFSNKPEGHLALLEWAQKQTNEALEAIHFVMEATGNYHEALAYPLYRAGAKV